MQNLPPETDPVERGPRPAMGGGGLVPEEMKRHQLEVSLSKRNKIIGLMCFLVVVVLVILFVAPHFDDRGRMIANLQTQSAQALAEKVDAQAKADKAIADAKIAADKAAADAKAALDAQQQLAVAQKAAADAKTAQDAADKAKAASDAELAKLKAQPTPAPAVANASATATASAPSAPDVSGLHLEQLKVQVSAQPAGQGPGGWQNAFAHYRDAAQADAAANPTHRQMIMARVGLYQKVLSGQKITAQEHLILERQAALKDKMGSAENAGYLRAGLAANDALPN